MALLNIKNFLAKFNFPAPPAKTLEQELVGILEKTLDFPPENYQVKIKEPVVFISCPDPALKNELFLNQNRILNHLKNKFPTCVFSRIQFTL